MWSFTSSRSKLAEVHKVTRRIVDSTVARHCFEDQRRDTRIARQLPVFVAAYDQKSGTIGEVSNAVTKDISDDGIGLLTTKKIDASQVIIALALDSEPKFLLGELSSNRAFGAGLCHAGIAVKEVLDPEQGSAASQLLPLIAYLSPDQSSSGL